jgi:hypothetical protein
MEYKLKSMATALWDTLLNYLHKTNRDWLEQEQIRQNNQLQQIASQGQIFLIDALWQCLGNVHISNVLCPVSNPADLIPDGFFISGEYTVYKFRLCKKTTDKISVTVLHIIADKINKLIRAERNKFADVYRNQPPDQQGILVQNYPALWNGFYVVNCVDSYDDIVIQVAYY